MIIRSMARQPSRLQVTAPVTPENITTLTLTPAITGTALPVTFGHAFAQGDVPAGAEVEVSGKTTQFNALSTYSDGSIRHAAMTVLLNTTADVPQLVTLSTRDPAGGTAITKAAILASAFSASVSVVVSGTTYTLSVLDLLDNTITPLPDMTHWSGPQSASITVGGKLRNGGTPHAHLAAYFHLIAYAASGTVTRVYCDVVVENGWTFTSGSGLITCNPTIVVGGTTVYNSTSFSSYHHTKFYGSGWWGTDPQLTFKHNAAYLISTGMVPNYEQLTLDEELLSSFTTTYSPGGIAGLRSAWGDTGDHMQIGILPEWDACYAVSGDPRALSASIAASKAGGSYSYNYRDENTGHPVSIDTYPTLDEQSYGEGLIQGTGGTGYDHEQGNDASAHAPLLGYMAFLATAKNIHLEALHFQTNYFMVWRNSGGRDYLNGPEDGIVGLQNRGQAWGIRNLGAAAAITPDDHPLKSYFVEKLGNNIDEKTAHWASPSQNVFGHVQDYDWPTKVTPFENDFMLTVFGWLVDLGYTSATTMRNWLSKSPAGRLGQDASGYCAHFATPYAWTEGISPTPTGDTFYASWTDLYEANYPVESGSACPAGLKSDSYQNVPVTGDLTNGFYSNLKPALAYAVDAGVATEATWNQFVGYATNDYAFSARYNIVPRSISANPSWYTAMASNTVKEFTGNLMDSINPCPGGGCSYVGTEGFPAVNDSWSGGCYNSVDHEHVVWGGGHNASYNNGVNAWNLFTQTWSRLTEPKSPIVNADLVGGGGTNTTGYYTDGTPASRHTYNALAYDHVRNLMISVYAGATAGETGGQFQNCDAFDFSDNTWSVKATSPTLGSYGSPYGTMAATDEDGNIWSIYQGLAPVAKLDVVADTWTTYGSGYNYSGGPYCSAAIDTLRNRLVIIGSGYFTKTSLASPDTTTDCGGSPPTATFDAAAPLWVYDPVNDRFIGWSGGQTFDYVDAATLLTWGTFTPTGDTLPTCDEEGYQWRGTYGKGVYVPELHGLSICVQTGMPPYFVRL